MHSSTMHHDTLLVLVATIALSNSLRLSLSLDSEYSRVLLVVVRNLQRRQNACTDVVTLHQAGTDALSLWHHPGFTTAQAAAQLRHGAQHDGDALRNSP